MNGRHALVLAVGKLVIASDWNLVGGIEYACRGCLWSYLHHVVACPDVRNLSHDIHIDDRFTNGLLHPCRLDIFSHHEILEPFQLLVFR